MYTYIYMYYNITTAKMIETSLAGSLFLFCFFCVCFCVLMTFTFLSLVSLHVVSAKASCFPFCALCMSRFAFVSLVSMPNFPLKQNG